MGSISPYAVLALCVRRAWHIRYLSISLKPLFVVGEEVGLCKIVTRLVGVISACVHRRRARRLDASSASFSFMARQPMWLSWYWRGRRDQICGR